MWLTRRAIQNNSGERRREIRKEFFCLNSRFWLFLKVFSQPKKKAIQKTSYSSIIALTLQLSASSCANMFWFCFVKLLLTTKLLNAHKIFKTNKNTFTSHFNCCWFVLVQNSPWRKCGWNNCSICNCNKRKFKAFF